MMATASLPRLRRILPVLLQILLLSSVASAKEYTDQFKSWYPQLETPLETVLRKKCWAQYQDYLTGDTTGRQIDYESGAGARSVLVQPVVECLLTNSSEYVKSFMSSAQVLLGLTPTILAVLGTSTEEMAMMAVVGRRPVLSVLLAVGSPSVYFGRALADYNPLEMLAMPGDRFHAIRAGGRAKVAINVAEYFVAMGAVANIALLDWELGTQTICTFMSFTPLAPLLWGLLVIPCHLLGCLVVRLRIRRIAPGEEYRHVTLWRWIADLPRRVAYVFSNVFTPAGAQHGVRVALFREEYWKLGMRWLLSMVTIAHLIFGTLTLSSLLFMGPSDAIGVIARFCASVLACRVIVMYELAGVAVQFHGPEGGVVNRRVKPDEEDGITGIDGVHVNNGMSASTSDNSKAMAAVSESTGVQLLNDNNNNIAANLTYLGQGGQQHQFPSSVYQGGIQMYHQPVLYQPVQEYQQPVQNGQQQEPVQVQQSGQQQQRQQRQQRRQQRQQQRQQQQHVQY